MVLILSDSANRQSYWGPETGSDFARFTKQFGVCESVRANPFVLKKVISEAIDIVDSNLHHFLAGRPENRLKTDRKM
jgi:hypothetical protein